MNRYKKGQYFSFDAIIATLIFILTMVSIFSYWYNTRSALENQDSEMMREAARISDMLFMLPEVFPAGTTGCQVSLALVQSNTQQDYRTLSGNLIEDNKKLDSSGNSLCSESALQEGFGTPYKVYLTIKEPHSSDPITYSSIADFGDVPSSNEVVKLRRIANVRTTSVAGETTDQKAVVDIYLYK